MAVSKFPRALIAGGVAGVTVIGQPVFVAAYPVTVATDAGTVIIFLAATASAITPGFKGASVVVGLAAEFGDAGDAD